MSNSTLPYSTMKTDHSCGRIWRIHSVEELRDAIEKAYEPIIVGGGSNILFKDDIQNDLIVIRILGRSIEKEDKRTVTLSIGAGEEWHQFVLWTLENSWGGLENLSLIPGLCGAAPMQNIGAYGAELKDVLTWVEILDRDTLEIRKLQAEECELGYRDSIFKKSLQEKVIITSIGLRLTKEVFYHINTSYGAIEQELHSLKIETPNIRNVSQAVINIRTQKLPDPQVLPNNGSFFKNPVINQKEFQKLQIKFPDVPYYLLRDRKVKIPAGWLIDNAGLKGKREGGVGTHIKQALVIVNYDSASGSEVIQFALKVQKIVFEKYGIEISPEVNIYPT
ncbi:MAG: UDP-N-acetylmuramate dehydrogenase [Saprospiraceae bacterium]|jgi:UDP-N-acetylmuramate dehydrogenase